MQTIFILSHNSPDKCITLDTIKKYNYSGRWYIVIDDEDKYLASYKEKYGANLIIFNKEYFKRISDSGLSFEKTVGCALFARVAINYLAKELKLDTYSVCDDDITGIKFVELLHNTQQLKTHDIPNLSAVLNKITEYMIDCNIPCLSFATQNLFMGGYRGLTDLKSDRLRKVSNWFIFNTKRIKFDPFLSMYEDFVYGLQEGKCGQFVFSLPNIKMLTAPQHSMQNNNQSDIEGNAELYSKIKEYDRCFMPILAFPNCCFIKNFSNHLVISCKYENAFPKIISSKFKI